MPSITAFGIIGGLVIATSIFLNIYLYVTVNPPNKDKTYADVMIAANALAGLFLIAFMVFFVVQRFQSDYFGSWPLLLILGIFGIFVWNAFASNQIYGTRGSCMLFAINFALMAFSSGLMLVFVYYFVYSTSKMIKMPRTKRQLRSGTEMSSSNDFRSRELESLREHKRQSDIEKAVARQLATATATTSPPPPPPPPRKPKRKRKKPKQQRRRR